MIEATDAQEGMTVAAEECLLLTSDELRTAIKFLVDTPQQPAVDSIWEDIAALFGQNDARRILHIRDAMYAWESIGTYIIHSGEKQVRGLQMEVNSIKDDLAYNLLLGIMLLKSTIGKPGEVGLNSGKIVAVSERVHQLFGLDLEDLTFDMVLEAIAKDQL